MTSKALRSDILRAVANRRYEATDTGLFVPSAGVHVGGFFTVRVNNGPEEVSANTFTTEGVNYLLNTALRGAGQSSAWYVAPFAGNVTPGAALTAATYAATTTEFTQYDEATRVAWVNSAASAGVVASSTPFAFTMSAGVSGQTLYGAGILSVATKGATTGVLIAATRFASPKTGLSAGDVLSATYSLQLTVS